MLLPPPACLFHLVSRQTSAVSATPLQTILSCQGLAWQHGNLSRFGLLETPLDLDVESRLESPCTPL